MKRFILAIAALAILPTLASAQWTQLLRDDFNGGGGLPNAPATIPAGDYTANLNFNYVTGTTPAVGTPTGGDGTGFLLTANESATAISTSYVLMGNPIDKNRAIESVLCPYLSSSNSSGSTIFGGLGLRASAPIAGGLTSGYWAEFRTDTSGTYGNYINLYKKIASGSNDLLGRYYFSVGSGDIAMGSLTTPNESRAIKDPQATAVNTWVKARLEAEDVTGGTQIRLIVDDVTIVDWLDAAPVTEGQGILVVHDYFTSLSAPPASVGLIYDYVKYEERITDVSDWTLF